MTSFSFRYSALCAILALMGCGGGGGLDGGTTAQPSGPITGPSGRVYRDLDTTDSTTIPIGGAAIRNTPTGRDTTDVDGAITRPTGTLIVSDGTYTVTDPTGVDGTNTATDANGAELKLGTESSLGGYEYLTVGTVDYVTGSGPTNAIVVIGAITHTNDMPTTGQATYTGTAIVDEFSANCQCRHEGTATVVTDFENGEVTTTMGGFTTTSGNPALPPIQNFDTIIIADMQINGAEMSGGTVVTELNGSPVTLYGDNPNVSVNGTFYGLDHAGHPDEVGGVFLVDGDGVVMGVFVAD